MKKRAAILLLIAGLLSAWTWAQSPLDDLRKRAEEALGKKRGPTDDRIAAGLKPDAGNTTCSFCKADFWRKEDTLTLLECHEDPYRFGDRYLERTLHNAEIPWLAAGKTSGNKGLLCPQCDTEFDDDGQFLTLVHSPSVRLARATGRSLVMEDWHRMAQALPLVSVSQTRVVPTIK